MKLFTNLLEIPAGNEHDADLLGCAALMDFIEKRESDEEIAVEFRYDEERQVVSFRIAENAKRAEKILLMRSVVKMRQENVLQDLLAAEARGEDMAPNRVDVPEEENSWF